MRMKCNNAEKISYLSLAHRRCSELGTIYFLVSDEVLHCPCLFTLLGEERRSEVLTYFYFANSS